MSNDPQYQFWNQAFSGPEYFYGLEAGPVARRAVRYHRPLWRGSSEDSSPTALDLGCGEGQDLCFLAELGYWATGVEFTTAGVAKTNRLIHEHGLRAEVRQADLRAVEWPPKFDLVLAINVLQFLGEDAPHALKRVRDAVAVNGVLGLSLFARRPLDMTLREGVYHFSIEALLEYFAWQGAQRRWQLLETAELAQWNPTTNEPQLFLTLIARRLR